jgi:iron-sulfur cluster assembly protein
MSRRCQESQGNKELCLRVGVRQGGCSGMSYTMDFEDPANINEHDEVYDYEGFRVICDKKVYSTSTALCSTTATR